MGATPTCRCPTRSSTDPADAHDRDEQLADRLEAACCLRSTRGPARETVHDRNANVAASAATPSVAGLEPRRPTRQAVLTSTAELTV